MKISFISALSLIVSIASPVEGANGSSSDIRITDSAIMHSMADQNGQHELYRTTIIPYVEERSCYYWAIKFDQSFGEIEIDEELTLPAPADVWGVSSENSTAVSSDKASAVTKRTIDLQEGFATNGWCVAKGDPEGQYQFRLRAGSTILATLPFIVTSNR